MFRSCNSVTHNYIRNFFSIIYYFVCRCSLVSFSHYGATHSSVGATHHVLMSPGIIQCVRYIVEHEGPKALFKGLVPNIIGVAPSRAIYFGTYSQSKTFFNSCQLLPPDSAAVHMCSASCAGSFRCISIFKNNKHYHVHPIICDLKKMSSNKRLKAP